MAMQRQIDVGRRCACLRFFFLFFYTVLGSAAPWSSHLLEVISHDILVLQYGLCTYSLPDLSELSVLYCV